jgi:hypothetical protein
VISEETIRQILVLSDQPKEQVLSFDGRTSELAGFIAGKEDNPPCSFSVSFEHSLDSLKKPGSEHFPRLELRFRETLLYPSTLSFYGLFDCNRSAKPEQ